MIKIQEGDKDEYWDLGYPKEISGTGEKSGGTRDRFWEKQRVS
jgi:hypothetical protein